MGCGSLTKIFALADYINVPTIKGVGETFFAESVLFFRSIFQEITPPQTH